MTTLSSDRPSTDPKDDLFGHAPFAKSLADSICRHHGGDGMVLALYGSWGSGKSTVLSYVRYFLEQRPAIEQPVIITFNPWWFSGQENLARAFLGQLQAVLPGKSQKFKKLGDLLSDFAEGIGGLVDLTGATFGAGTRVGKVLGKLIKRKPKDVPALKAAISKVLADAQQRILVIIDDIDRLTPEETRQLFTVIKALADFPNVIYLLAFDREVAAEAISQQTGMPGERYLEKIIQVSFEIPPVDRTALHKAFFGRVNEVLVGTPDGMLDQFYWMNVFHDGIDALIKVPRDIVRFGNTLSVTYPSVVGEVNPVDFIAIEALRVFMPAVYDVVRSNQDQFAGHRSGGHGAYDEKVREGFHDAWIKDIPEELRKNTLSLLRRIFPKLEDTTYGADWVAEWRKSQRVCVPELFPTYFRLAVAPGTIRRSELVALLALADAPDLLGQALVKATLEKRSDGISKVDALLERLMDYVPRDIPDERIATFINVLLDVGDKLVLPGNPLELFNFSNESRVRWVVYHLLKRVDKAQRLTLLYEAFKQGQGIGVQCSLLGTLVDENSKQAGGNGALMDAADLDALKAIWLDKIRATEVNHLLDLSQLAKLLFRWNAWGNADEVRAWCVRVTEADDGLMTFLLHFCSHTRSQTIGDYAERTQPRLNPNHLEKYLDTEAVAARLAEHQQAGTIPEQAKESVTQYLTEFAMIKAGIDPDGLRAFGD
jgi:predicted KAP-like P-loop ATPase